MTAIDLADVTARVAERLARPADDVDVIGAVEAAAAFVAVTEGHVDDTGTPLPLPDDARTVHALQGFARAWYLDLVASRGASVAFGDQVIDTVYAPEDIYRHWHHLFVHLKREFPVA